MTQVFALHSAYGIATAAAAVDAGLVDAGPAVERILVPFTSSRVPETTVGIADDPALRTLRTRFHRVEPLSEALGPLHPSGWEPAEADLPVLERLLARAWAVDPADLELFVQSPQVAPSRTLMALFPRARITIVGDGLMTYSPMRVRLPQAIAARIERVLHADVVPGVRPLVASPNAEAVPVPPASFAAALREADEPDASVEPGPTTVLVLGQYLSALGLMSAARELALQQQLVDRAARWAPERIVFKPHPAAPPQLSDAVRVRVEGHGMAFAEQRGRSPAELLAERLDVRAVVASFSTALPTVRALFDRPIGSAGTAELLSTLSPFANSNRVPVTLIDALTRNDSPYRAPERLQALVDAVGYVMQPEIAGHLRERAEELLLDLDDVERRRYFAPERLLALHLPGAPRPSPLQRALRPVGGVGLVEEWRLTARGAQRRVGRAWREIRGR